MSPLSTYDTRTFIIPIIQMKKLRLRQGMKARKLQNWDLNPRGLGPKSRLFLLLCSEVEGFVFGSLSSLPLRLSLQPRQIYGLSNL